MKRRLIGWVLTTIVAACVHEMSGRHLAAVDVVLAVTARDVVAMLVAAALVFSRLWLMFILPSACSALLASRLWRIVSGRTPTEERLRRAL